MTDQIIDKDALNSLKDLMGDSLGPLLAAFQDNVKDLLGQAKVGFDAGDNLEIAKVGHTLKSPSGQLGAVALSAKAQELETAGKDNDMDAIPALLSQASDIAEKTFEELKSI